MDSSSSAIRIENVWKVFGNTSQTALDAIQNDKISKTEALEKYNSVIKHNIGLRLQSRLTKEQAKFVASCNSIHRDISLNF